MATLDRTAGLRVQLVRFSTFWWGAFALLAALLGSMYASFPGTVPKHYFSLLPITVSVVAALALLSVFIRWRRDLAKTRLYAIDFAFVMLVSCDLGASVFMSADKINNVYACFIGTLFLLIAHAIIVPGSRRRVLWLSASALAPLCIGAGAIALFRPEHLPAPAAVFMASTALFALASMALVSWLHRAGVHSGAIAELAPNTDARPRRRRGAIGQRLVWCTRMTLRAVQYLATRLAHIGERRAPLPRVFHRWDVFLAHRLARDIPDRSMVLDVGCGNGHRLHELSLFRDLESAVGVDVVPPVSDHVTPGVDLRTFDGQDLPFADRSFDVTMICYVLHHLSPEHADRMLREAIRVSRDAVILLEDSLPRWSWLYRLRNFCHRVDADLEYAAGSDDYTKAPGQAMFLTRPQWRARLDALPGVARVVTTPISPPMKYKHHTMFRLELADVGRHRR